MKKNTGPKRMDDIARLAGVSKPTVSRALQDSPLVSDETKKRILEIARRHGYVVNRNAQNLRRRRTDTIAVVIDFPHLPDNRLTDPFHFELLGNITNALAVRQQDVLLCSSQSAHSGGFEHLLSNKGVDGIIFLGQSGHHEEFRALARTAVPFVVWGAHRDDATYCVLGSDNPLGGRLVAERFRSLKRKRAMFLGPRGHIEIEQRHRSFAESWGRAFEELEVPDLSFVASRDAMLERLDSGKPAPDAVFAGSDTMAMGALAALRERGIEVPADCSVCGYDDSPSAVHHSPPLTTIRQDTRMAGAILVERLMQAIQGTPAASVLLPTDLIVRAT
ncbi:LacI family DNA-binding transcriptional regulator [Solimonas terrae]|uniref:LacI family transcriptional regulator n=1 Tax=Solimonas terrae TaxID=1396819 RepID=A0A6M2BK91_9GAMM|nr:LacI family DNA-binding transcriptional regulator [Solimonas terrae]NGY03282.1 LacI family transcriptional regulator [Solimonas terrae]